VLEGLAADRPTQPSLLVQAGEAFLDMGQPAKAATLVQEAVQKDTRSVLVRMLAGRVAQANGQPDAARRHFNEVLRRKPRHAEALVELGRLDEASGKSARARRRFAAALKLRPKDPELLFLVARAQARAGNTRSAYANGSQAVRLLKGSGQAGRAFELNMELGKLLAHGDKFARKRAEEIFFEATKPKNAPARPFLELGRVHRSQNELNRAVWCFREAAKRAPNLAEAQLELGRTLRVKPKWRRQAKAALRRYLKLSPDSKEAPKVRAMLERMR
jgi:tetratricopeptide (TPR) repeat protein